MGRAAWLFPVPPGSGSAKRQGPEFEAEGAEPSWARSTCGQGKGDAAQNARREPRANMRACSYHASPGPGQGNVLWIGLWMIYLNTLVNLSTAVDKGSCGKVDNRCEKRVLPGRGPSAIHRGVTSPANNYRKPLPEGSASTPGCPLRWMSRARRQAYR